MANPWQRDTAVRGNGAFHSPIALGTMYVVHQAWQAPSSYTTGGDIIYAKDLNLGNIYSIELTDIAGTQCAFPIFATDSPVQSVLIKLTDLAGTQATNASDQSAKRYIIRAFGSI